MPVGGIKLTIPEALAVVWDAGFRGRTRLITAVCVMTAESGRFVEAWNVNANESLDRGLFQINSLHAALGMQDSFKVLPNAAFAFNLSQGGTNFRPWNAFVSGAWEQFKPDVSRVFDEGNQAWRGLSPFAEPGADMFGEEMKAGWGAHRAGMVKDPAWTDDKKFGWNAREEAVENPQVHLIEHDHDLPEHRHPHVHGEDVEVDGVEA